MRGVIALSLTGCINIESGKGPDTGVVYAPDGGTEIPFIDDCTEASNDVADDASGVPRSSPTDRTELCDDDLDFYRLEVGPGTWMSLSMWIDGSGHNGTDNSDLDLWELNRVDTPIDTQLDRYDTDLDGMDIIWSSAAHSPLERLAWFNPTSRYVSHIPAKSGPMGLPSASQGRQTANHSRPVGGAYVVFAELASS